MDLGDFIGLGIYYAKCVEKDCKADNVELTNSELISTIVASILSEYHKLLMSELLKQGIKVTDFFHGEREYHFSDVLKQI